MCQGVDSDKSGLSIDVLLAACIQTDAPFNHVSINQLVNLGCSTEFSNSNTSIPSTQLYNSNSNYITDDPLNNVSTFHDYTGKKSQKHSAHSTKIPTNLAPKQIKSPSNSNTKLLNNHSIGKLSGNNFYNVKNLAKFFPSAPPNNIPQSNDLPDTKSLILLLLTQNQIMMERLKNQEQNIDKLIKELKRINGTNRVKLMR